MNNMDSNEVNRLVTPVEEEVSLTRLLPVVAAANPATLALIPFAYMAFNKNINKKNSTVSKSSKRSRRKKVKKEKVKKQRSGLIDQGSIDKVSYLLDTLEKASSLSDAKKASTKSSKSNYTFFKEAVNIVGGAQSKEIMQSVSNVVTLMERARDLKNITNLKKAFTSDSSDFNEQLDTLAEAVKPLLSKQQFQSVESIKRMAQMVKVMSALNLSDDDDDDLEPDTDVEVSTVEDHSNESLEQLESDLSSDDSNDLDKDITSSQEQDDHIPTPLLSEEDDDDSNEGVIEIED